MTREESNKKINEMLRLTAEEQAKHPSIEMKTFSKLAELVIELRKTNECFAFLTDYVEIGGKRNDETDR